MNTAPNLAALLGHLNRHPHLDDGAIIRADIHESHGIEVHASSTNQTLGLLAQWVRTLTGVEQILIEAITDRHTPVDGTYTHVAVKGQLANGSPIRVRVLLDDNEVDLLAANTPVEQGATFPVDLLHQLTNAADAEQVPA